MLGNVRLTWRKHVDQKHPFMRKSDTFIQNIDHIVSYGNEDF